MRFKPIAHKSANTLDGLIFSIEPLVIYNRPGEMNFRSAKFPSGRTDSRQISETSEIDETSIVIDLKSTISDQSMISYLTSDDSVGTENGANDLDQLINNMFEEAESEIEEKIEQRQVKELQDTSKFKRNIIKIRSIESCPACGVEESVLWRKQPYSDKKLCNACGIRLQRVRVLCKRCYHVPKKAEFSEFGNFCAKCGAEFFK